MKILSLSFSKVVLATLATIGFTSLLMPESSFAQQVINQQNSDSPNSTNPFSQGVEQNNFNMFQLIHNANLGNLNPNFANEQNEQLNSAALEFRKKQQQVLQGQQQPINPGVGVVMPKTVTPQSGN